MSAQPLQKLKHPYSLLAANPANVNNQRTFIRWLNGYTTSEMYKQYDVPSKLKFFNKVKKNLQTIINNIGNPGVGAGTAATTTSRKLYTKSLQSLVDIVRQKELRLSVLPEAVPAPPTKDMYSSVDTDARLGEIQERLLQFQENQHNHGKFTQMASEAKALTDELQHIQETLPPSEHTTLFTISQLLIALNAWDEYFIRKSKTTPEVVAPMIAPPPEGLSEKVKGYEESVKEALDPRKGRRVDLSLEERVAELRNLSSPERGTKKEPGEKYFAPGGKRKTRKRRRRRKRKTRKHRKKKRTRRRKPKKRHRRTKRR